MPAAPFFDTERLHRGAAEKSLAEETFTTFGKVD
jgi:hypothetical protein